MSSDGNAAFDLARAVHRVASPAIDWVDTFSSLVVQELRNGPSVPVPLRRRLWLYRNGFTSRADVLHDFASWAPSDYLNSWEFLRTQSINRPWGAVVENKLSFHHLMSAYPAHRPTVFGFVDGGRRKPVEGGSVDDAPVDEWLAELLRTHGSLVLKPVHGYGGDGVHVCEWGTDGPVVDGDRMAHEAFAAFASDLESYLVTERVLQAAYAERIFPDATNTVRLYTMYDEAAGEPFVPAASHRFGTRASAPVDNWNRGGLASLVDVDTGELGEAAWVTDSSELRRSDVHPDTGERIAGERVPGWSAIVERIREMAATFSQAPFLGWDVVVEEDGGFAVLEANAAPGVTTVQVHRPLKTIPGVEEFLRQQGIG